MALYIVRRTMSDGSHDEFKANLHWNYKTALSRANMLYSLSDDIEITPAYRSTPIGINDFSIDGLRNIEQLAYLLESAQSSIGINKFYLRNIDGYHARWKKDVFFPDLHQYQFEDQLKALVSYSKFKYNELHSVFRQSLAKHDLRESDFYHSGSDWCTRRDKFSSHEI